MAWSCRVVARPCVPSSASRGEVAGKTGTTQDNTDGWFIMMHPRLVAGAWVGFNDARVTMRSSYWGQGAHNALPVVGDFFQQAVGRRMIDVGAHFPKARDALPASQIWGPALDWLRELLGVTTTPPHPTESIRSPAPQATRRVAPAVPVPVEPLDDPVPTPEQPIEPQPYQPAAPYPNQSPYPEPSPAPAPFPYSTPAPAPAPFSYPAPPPAPSSTPPQYPAPTASAPLSPSPAPYQPLPPPPPPRTSQRSEAPGRVAPPTAFELEIENERKTGRKAAPREPDPVDNVINSVRRALE